jgi:FKBP-type peptidyl-prolyl cis-trans isomerase 2
MVKKLKIKTLRASTGRELQDGDLVAVLYSGSLIGGDGEVFDANWNFTTFEPVQGRELFTFPLGDGNVIVGWEKGLSDARVGEVLQLKIPAQQAYGNQALPGIPAGSDLNFTVEIVGVVPKGKSQPVLANFEDIGLAKKLINRINQRAASTQASKVGTDLADVIIGTPLADLLIGEDGKDTITGDKSADLLIGGGGGDTYVYLDVDDSLPGDGQRDQVLDFSRKEDRVNLSALNAEGNLRFIGRRSFSEQPGEVRFGGGLLQFDQDGDGQADLEVALAGVKRFGSSNLVL